MKLGNILGVAAALGITSVSVGASAEEAATSTTASPAAATATSAVVASDGHATGVMLQARLQGSGSLLSLGGGPSFLFGYQGQSFALGLGLGLNRVGFSAGSDNSASLTLFQVMPTAIVDVWHSADGRARANLIGGVGYGRASLSATETAQDCVFDALGNETCSNKPRDVSAGASFLPVMLGFGGDYFLSRNFALGAEVGLQAAFTVGVDSTTSGVSKSADGSANLQVAYGALRATFVLGD